MNKVMNISYDGVGLVNNRGVSKYWGVSADPVETGKWRVLVNLAGSMYTFQLPATIAGSEKDAAHIAKHLYHFHFSDKALPGFLYILPFWSIKEYTQQSRLYRLDFINKKIDLVPQSTFGKQVETFDWEDLKSKIEAVSGTATKKGVSIVPKQENSQDTFVNEISDMVDPFNLPSSEEDIIREFIGNVLSDNMTIRGRKVLNTMARVLSE